MLRILIVEDNRLNQELARALLESEGHFVTVVDDGARLRDTLGHATPDMILMDVQLPDTDGITLLREIRGSPALRTIPVLAVTAHALRGDIERFLAEGFDAV